MDWTLISFLCNHYYLFLKLLFILYALSFLFVFEDVAALCRCVSKKTWISLSAIVLLGFILRLWLVPHTHHVFYDEYIHVNIAQNFLHMGKLSLTLQGAPGAQEAYTLPMWPPAYHYLLSVVFSVFGATESVAFHFSALIGALSVAVMFLFLFLLWRDELTALAGAFMFNLIPAHLKFSGGSETGIFSLFLILWALSAALIYARRPGTKSALFLVVALAAALYARPENGLLLLLIPLIAFLIRDKSNLPFFIFWIMPLAFFYFVHLYVGLFVFPPPGWNESWPVRLMRMGLHMVHNAQYWTSVFHPVSMTLLALGGLVLSFKKEAKVAAFFLIWFLFFYFCYSLYHIGDLLILPDSSRYALNLYVSVVVFSSVALAALVRRFRVAGRWTAVFLLCCVFFDAFSPLRHELKRTLDRDHQREYRFLLASRDLLPDDVYILAYHPAIVVSGLGKKSIGPLPFWKLFVERSALPERLVFFKEAGWSKEQEETRKVEERLLASYDFKMLSRMTHPDGKECVFFLLTKKSLPAPQEVSA